MSWALHVPSAPLPDVVLLVSTVRHVYTQGEHGPAQHTQAWLSSPGRFQNFGLYNKDQCNDPVTVTGARPSVCLPPTPEINRLSQYGPVCGLRAGSWCQAFETSKRHQRGSLLNAILSSRRSQGSDKHCLMVKVGSASRLPLSIFTLPHASLSQQLAFPSLFPQLQNGGEDNSPRGLQPGVMRRRVDRG